jgi:hypothetical protein
MTHEQRQVPIFKMTAEQRAERHNNDLKARLRREFEAACNEIIPLKYRDIIPSKLQASTKSNLPLAEQTKLYAEINAKPLEGWAFFAPAGYSKTTCSWAIFKHALLANLKHAIISGQEEFKSRGFMHPGPSLRNLRLFTPCYVWHVSVPEWLERIQASWDDPTVAKPALTSEKIEKARKSGFTPRVFLEEIDKIKEGSEWATGKLFNLINEIDKHKGQLVLDSNLSKQQFLARFGEPFCRRVKENCNMREFGF